MSSGIIYRINWVIAANTVAGLLNLLTLAWFSRLLGPNALGSYVLLSAALQVIAALLSAGFDQAVIRKPDDPSIYAAASFATIVQVTAYAAISTAFILFLMLSDKSRGIEFLVLAFAIAGTTVLSYVYHLMAARFASRQNYKFLSIVRVISVVAGVVSAMLLSLFYQNVLIIALRDLVMASVMLGLVWEKFHSPTKSFVDIKRSQQSAAFFFGYVGT